MSADGRRGLQETLLAYRGRIAIAFVLISVVYFLVAFGEQAWRARQLQAQAAQQRAAIATLDEENAALRRQLDGYATDAYYDYVQQRARRDLNLANPGETLLLVRWSDRAAPPAATPTPAPPADEQPNWRRWVEVFGGD